MSTIPVNLAVEDDLSEPVLRRLLTYSARGFAVGTVFGHTGYGYLRRTIGGWNRAARGIPIIVLTDLDRYRCPMALIREWIPSHQHPNLLVRVAVREVESWLMADADGLSAFLKIKRDIIPPGPDSLPDAKATLVNAAAKSRSREIRYRIVPKRGSTAKQGPEYNSCLTEFVEHDWEIEAAAGSSPSLARTVARIRDYNRTW